MFRVVAHVVYKDAERGLPVFYLDCDKNDAFAKARDILSRYDRIYLSIMDVNTLEFLEENDG